eukprot:359167_1
MSTPLRTNIYGFDYYENKKCFTSESSEFNFQHIRDSIPIVALNFENSNCNHNEYIDILLKFQEKGARGLIILTNMDDNTTLEHPKDVTKFWVQFECIMQFDAEIDLVVSHNNTDYLATKYNITQEIVKLLNTNITNTQFTSMSNDNKLIKYSFKADTTNERLDIDIIDNVIAAYISLYLKSISINTKQIICNHLEEKPQIIIYSDNENNKIEPSISPTQKPTNAPITRSSKYNNLHIPVAMVESIEAHKLLTYVQNNDISFISWSCTSDTSFRHESQESESLLLLPDEEAVYPNKLDEIILFIYDSNDNMITTITFPLHSSYAFNALSEYCNMHLSVSDQKMNNFYISIQTIFYDIHKICIQNNNQDVFGNINHDWEETIIKHDENCILFSNQLTRNTYCFALWQNEESENKNVWDLRIKLLFKWTSSFMRIDNTEFINNSVINGNGGAISIISTKNVDEITSISITNSEFNLNNVLNDGVGEAIYRRFSYSGINNIISNYMSVFQLENVSVIIPNNNNGSFIYCELDTTYSTYYDSLLLKNAILLNNINITSDEMYVVKSNNIYGGALYLSSSNVYISNMEILNVNSSAGAIYLDNTIFELYSSQFLSNYANYNGSVIVQSLYDVYYFYDLCVSLFDNNFENNMAEDYGGSIYVELHGHNSDRESCFKVSNNTFTNNAAKHGTGNAIYFNVINGDHKILQNEGYLSTICDIDCTDYYSSLSYLCADIELPGAIICENKNITQYNDDIDIWPLLITNPGASETIYVHGYDAFGNKIISYDFNIFAESIYESLNFPYENAHILASSGSTSWRDIYEKIIPLTISPGLNVTNGLITIYDTNNIAEPFLINISIQDCKPGYFKNIDKIIPGIFKCELCQPNTYTINNGKCESCHELNGIECEGANNINVKHNWYAKIEHKTIDTTTKRRRLIDNEEEQSYLEIETANCPPGYCCSERDGCYFSHNNMSKKETLCGINRNSSVIMCGQCLNGYSETLSSIGSCKNCDGNQWVIVLYIIGCLLLIYLLYYFSKKERRAPHPLNTYLTRSLLFFYQIFGFIIFRSFLPGFQTITELTNLTFNFSKEGTCLLSNIGPRSKLTMTLIVPIILLFDLGLLFAFIYYKFKYKHKIPSENIDANEGDITFNNQIISFQTVCDYIIRIIYVQFTYTFLRLSVCAEYDGELFMWYAGQVECYDSGHIFCWIILCFLIFIFPLILYLIQYYYYNTNRDLFEKIFTSSTLSYREGCWWYSSIDIFRRGILVSIPLIPTIPLTGRAVLIMLFTGLLILIHGAIMPYRWRINNWLEIFVLIMIFFSAAVNVSQEHEKWMDNLLITFGVLPFVPIFFILIFEFETDYMKSIKICDCKNMKRHLSSRYENLPRTSNVIDIDTAQPTTDGEKNEINNAEEESDDDETTNNMKSNEANTNNKNDDDNNYVSTTTLTRFGWKYPFKLNIMGFLNKYIQCGNNNNNQNNINEMTLTLTFSDELPLNTLIDSADIGQHLNYHTKYLNYRIKVQKISPSKMNINSQYNIQFQCLWNQTKTKKSSSITFSPEIEMETSLIQTFEDNDALKGDLMKSFKLPKSSQFEHITIVSIELKGSMSAKNKENVLIQKIMERQNEEKDRMNKEMNDNKQMKYLSLHLFDELQIIFGE